MRWHDAPAVDPKCIGHDKAQHYQAGQHREPTKRFSDKSSNNMLGSPESTQGKKLNWKHFGSGMCVKEMLFSEADVKLKNLSKQRTKLLYATSQTCCVDNRHTSRQEQVRYKMNVKQQSQRRSRE